MLFKLHKEFVSCKINNQPSQTLEATFPYDIMQIITLLNTYSITNDILTLDLHMTTSKLKH